MEVKQSKEISGGDFIIHNDKLISIFTPEDFSEEQLMMKDSVKEFIDREVWPYKDRFEKKRLWFYKIFNGESWGTRFSRRFNS